MSAGSTAAQTRILRNALPQPDSALSFAERVALLACAFSRDRAEGLMLGFAGGLQELGVAQVRQALAWDSATRQARVTHEFGVRTNHLEPLKQLLAECAPALRAAVFLRLAPWQQSLFPQLKGSTVAEGAAPALWAMAGRLVREATRQSP